MAGNVRGFKTKALAIWKWKKRRGKLSKQTLRNVQFYVQLCTENQNRMSIFSYPVYTAQFLVSMTNSRKSSWTQQTELLRFCAPLSFMSMKLTVAQKWCHSVGCAQRTNATQQLWWHIKQTLIFFYCSFSYGFFKKIRFKLSLKKRPKKNHNEMVSENFSTDDKAWAR